MSSISKMQIRGIRSFSPDHDETIEFYSPLTMIVGANGCGKTTIIESLKFSCTGSLPPNTKGGQSFVNDPCMTDSTEVKAHIKLRFQNRSDQTCVSVRSLQVTKKRTKLEFKALEGVLRTTNNQGEKVSIGLKCTDMDRVFPENLGVSPAILENVIFCHQEESNWPMQEGMVLKKKFDDVFESTRYTKALEAFTKAKKDFQSKSKDLKAELMEYGAHLLSANQAKTDLANCEENQEYCRSELEKIAERLQRNEDRLRNCNDVLKTAQSSVEELSKVQWHVTEGERRVFEKTKALESKLDGSDAELQMTLLNFENTMQSRANELRAMQKRADSLAHEVSQLREQTEQLNLKKGQAVLLQEQSKKLREDQVQQSRSLQRTFNLPMPAANWTQAAARDYLQTVNNEVRRVEVEANESIAASRRVVEGQERDCNETKMAVQKLDMELSLKSEEFNGIDREAAQKRSELSRLGSSRNAIQQNQVDYESALRSHDEFNATYNNKANDLKRHMKDATDQIRTLTEEIQNDSALLQDLSMHRNELATLEATIKQLDLESGEIAADVTSAFRTHREVLTEFRVPLDCRALEEVMEAVESRSENFDRQHSAKRDEVTKLKNKLAANDALLTQEHSRVHALNAKTENLGAKERDIRNFVNQLNTVRGNKVLVGTGFADIPANIGITELMEFAKATEDEARELLIIAKSGKVFMKRLKKSRQSSNGNCPCCSQSMSGAVAETYERNIKDLFTFGDEAQQGTVEEHKTVFHTCSDIYSAVQELQTSLMPLMDLREDIAQGEAKIAELEDKSNVIRAQIQSMDTEVHDTEQRASLHSKALRTLSDLNTRWQAVAKRQTEFDDKKRRQSQSVMGFELGGRTIFDLEQQQRQRAEMKDELQSKKDRLTTEEANLTKRMFNFKSVLAEREKALSDAKIEGNKYTELEAAIARLHTRMNEIDDRKAVVSRERDGLMRELSEKTKVLNRAKADLKQVEDSCGEKLGAIRSERDSFGKAVENLEEVDRRFNELNLANVTENLERAHRSVNAKEDEIKTLTPKVNAINAELTSQEHTKRNVTSNIELRANELELKTLKQQLTLLERNTGGNAAAIKTAEKEYTLATREGQTLTSERDTLRGKLEVHNQQVADLRGKLNNSTYRGIEEKHRRKNIEFETTNMAVLDLESYHNALDRALQNFHTLKIKEINKIIRELWQLIYKGQDIDMIELESGQDAETAAAAKGSRSYNYRVVMRKGDVPLDMRGRCSAGQKVLAAIVIRLALAETFCLNCGILALDEPTTNLDEPNKAGLAHALSRIILSRSRQMNFQLICITHDEEFVKMMSDELSGSADFNLPEYYFRVYRKEEGHTGKFFSHIERIPWEDM